MWETKAYSSVVKVQNVSFFSEIVYALLVGCDMLLAVVNSGKRKIVSQAVSQACGHINCGAATSFTRIDK